MDSKPKPDKHYGALYWPTQMIVARHLFPWKSGQDTMGAIFGRPDDDASEPFRAENDILYSQVKSKRDLKPTFSWLYRIFQIRLDKRKFDNWEAPSPKEYKIRILNPRDAKMTEKIFDTKKRWADLDNQRVQFKTDFRPRASTCISPIAKRYSVNLSLVST